MFIWLSDANDPQAERRVTFLRELRRRLQVLPGVEGVAIANDLPIRGNGSSTYPIIEGSPVLTENERVLTGVHAVSPDYFHADGYSIAPGA